MGDPEFETILAGLQTCFEHEDAIFSIVLLNVCPAAMRIRCNPQRISLAGLVAPCAAQSLASTIVLSSVA
ncbi:MAG: hypothetical protein E5W38_13795 [Mesorhizobium sp.]|nr:MAG: hypothetical protein E5W38_13795 [Mesorhizobium sp.]